MAVSTNKHKALTLFFSARKKEKGGGGRRWGVALQRAGLEKLRSLTS